MKKFEEMKFNIPALKGISARTIEEHLKLYAGYVKNANNIVDALMKLHSDMAANSYTIGELHRRLSFEYNGIRNHEMYFSALEGGPKSLSPESNLAKAIGQEAGTFDGFLGAMKNLATTTRGIGWAVLWYDKKEKRFLGSWVDEQHLGLLNGATPILMIDMWEHSYVADYQPSGKKNYVDDFFTNLNWEVVEKNFLKAKE